MRESILNFDENHKLLSSNTDLSGNNNTNIDNITSNYSYDTKINLDRISVMSTKDNPNEFEKFNFDSDMKKYKMGKFYGNISQNKNISDDNLSRISGQRSVTSVMSKKNKFSNSNLNNITSANNSTSNCNRVSAKFQVSITDSTQISDEQAGLLVLESLRDSMNNIEKK